MNQSEFINIHDAKRIMDTEEVIVVDIRDAQSYESGHIKDAVFINNESIQSFLEKADRTKPVICYCYHGISSRTAVEYFKQNGFERVYSIDGGFEGWRQVYPITGDKNNSA